jgi:hypothetical protein
MSLLTGSRHLGDEDLLRYIDHELDHEGMRLGGVHLRTCAECTARLEAMRHASATVHDWLALIPAEPDPSRRAAAQAAMERTRFSRGASGPLGTGWMKIAAAFVLMVGTGLATEPGRAFVAEGIVRAAGREPGPFATRMVEWLGQQRQLERELGVQRPATTTQPAPAAVPLPAATAPARAADAAPAEAPPPARIKPGTSAPVRSRPSGPDVTVTFASVQSRGSATLWIREEAREASVQATSNYRGEELLAGASGLEVRNGGRSRADYTIVIPARYRYIRVRVADGPEAVIHISKSKQEWLWTIPLQTSALEEPEPEP